MIIQKLNIGGLRVFEQAEFIFQPGMNLIVGVNGAGKTTVLDALRTCLSIIASEMTPSRETPTYIEVEDVNFKMEALQLICEIKVEKALHRLTIHKPKRAGKVVESNDGQSKYIDTPTLVTFDREFISNFNEYRQRENQPLILFFSTRRSLAIDQNNPTPKFGKAAAYSGAFSMNRDFNIREIANWLKAQQALSEETSKIKRLISAVQNAIATFMPGYDNLHVETNKAGGNRLMISKVDQNIYVKQLSDGERGVISIVAEIARRLVVANPALDNPIQNGEGIILIDELDLHLHPKWQRSVVGNLTRTFPKCQFIVTTHSPQIIPTVEPEHVQIIRTNEVIRPDRTFGMDSNWILKFIMEADDRPEESQIAIEDVEKLIREGKFKSARQKILDYKKDQNLDLPEWSILEARMARMEIIARKK